MLSIIVPIHNGEAYNRLFLRSLKEYTVSDYELIVVDNCSDDGSTQLFKDAGAVLLRNEENYCYACSMNQGLAVAKGEYICFANNDLWFGRAWDVPLVSALGAGEWVTCPAGIEAAESDEAKNRLRRRWGMAGLPLKVLGSTDFALSWSLKLMYGDWDDFCEERSSRLKDTMVDGIQGNCLICRKELFDLIGPWDVRTWSADWNLYLTVSKRAEEHGDVKKVKVVPGSYVHHFIRGTARKEYPTFACGHIKRGLDGLWTEDEIKRYGWSK
jgi:glycosyltransferase involved in cell wall biosynthesis